MSVSIKDDRSKWDRFRKDIETLKNADIKIGVQGEKGANIHEGSQATVADIGAFHEFGLGVPQRSFLRDWMTEDKDRIDKVIRNVVQQVLKGKMTANNALEQAGAVFVGWVQVRISNRLSPPLAASTIARKKSDIPLIDQGILRSAITYVVSFGE